MSDTLPGRFKAAWNAFTNKDPTIESSDKGPSYSVRPDRTRFTGTNEKSIVGGLYLRAAIDVSALPVLHCRTNEDLQFLGSIKSPLNDCLTLSANIDQTGRAFIQDVVMSLFNEGYVGIIPVDTSVNPVDSSFDIHTMRTGRIVEWYPGHVRVSVYNDRKGEREELVLPKTVVAIVENPFYSVMNEPNSVLKRLVAKLNLLDSIDIQSGSGKLDLIIQMPYAVKSDDRKKQAEERVSNLEAQLNNKKFGIAYIDAVEKVIPLNRSVENNLMAQVEYLTSMLYSQLGIAQSVFDGTADEATMLNWHSRMIEPTMGAIVNAMKRTFLSKTARSQGQSIMAFRDPFKLVPIKDLAEFADKFTRNEIVTSNELRSVIGLKPSSDPGADELRNKNLNKATDTPEVGVDNPGSVPTKPKKEIV